MKAIFVPNAKRNLFRPPRSLATRIPADSHAQDTPVTGATCGTMGAASGSRDAALGASVLLWEQEVPSGAQKVQPLALGVQLSAQRAPPWAQGSSFKRPRGTICAISSIYV